MQEATAASSPEMNNLPTLAGQRGGSARRTKLLLSTFFLGVALIHILPFYWMTISAVRPPERIIADAGNFLPTSFTLQNFQTLLASNPYVQWYINSIILAVSFAALSVTVCTLAGYALALYKFRGREELFFAVLGSQMIPFYLVLVPLFLIIVRTGLINQYIGVILPIVAQPFGLFYMRQYIRGISRELIDAGRVDGASEYNIFGSIVLPLCKPGMSAIFILFSIDMWNSLIWPLIVMREEAKFPLSVGLAGMISTYRSLFGELIAGSLLATVPMILLFLIFQRQFLTGMSVTGVIVEK